MTSHDIPLRRPGPSPGRLRQVVVLLSLLGVVWVVTAVLALRTGPKERLHVRLLDELRHLAKANPEADAAEHWATGDRRLLILDRGDGSVIPGANNPDARSKFGVRVIPIPFDSPANNQQAKLQHDAWQYAFNYNIYIIKKLNAQTQPSTTQATAAARASTTQTFDRH